MKIYKVNNKYNTQSSERRSPNNYRKKKLQKAKHVNHVKIYKNKKTTGKWIGID